MLEFLNWNYWDALDSPLAGAWPYTHGKEESDLFYPHLMKEQRSCGSAAKAHVACAELLPLKLAAQLSHLCDFSGSDMSACFLFLIPFSSVTSDMT